MTNESPHAKSPVYWDYWSEMVKASVYRETRELPAIIEAAEITGKNVIDAGCGPGRLILPFSNLAKTITAVDENDWAIKAVQKLIKENKLQNKVQVVQAPLVSLPFDDGVSESTYCMWVIHYAKSRWEKIVKELVRVTIPGNPVVVGFGSSEKDLPRFEEITKTDRVKLCKQFDAHFPDWCKEQGWQMVIKKVPLAFEFKSPEWALEVFSNTFVTRDATDVQRKEMLTFLRNHTKKGGCVIEQELRLSVIRSLGATIK